MNEHTCIKDDGGTPMRHCEACAEEALQRRAKTWATYDWAYLCNHQRRLQLTLRLLPREPLVGLRTMHICYASHLDPPNTPHVLSVVAQRHAPPWLRFQVTDLSPAVMTFGRRYTRLGQYFANDKPRWALGMKLLIPLVIGTPYLYTDDDVIVSRDPQYLMDDSFGSKGCFRFNGRKLGVAEQLFDAFEVPYDKGGTLSVHPSVFYDERALDAGVWFQRYQDDWAYRLERFAAMPYLADLTTRNLELRCLDQRFLTCFGIKHGWRQQRIGNGFAPPTQVSERMLARHPFFHYKSSSKERWMNLLNDYAWEKFNR